MCQTLCDSQYRSEIKHSFLIVCRSKKIVDNIDNIYEK